MGPAGGTGQGGGAKFVPGEEEEEAGEEQCRLYVAGLMLLPLLPAPELAQPPDPAGAAGE